MIGPRPASGPRLTPLSRQYAAVLTGFLAQWSVSLVASSVAPLAPLFQPELGLSKTEVGFFSSAAFAGAWSLLLLGGVAADRLGARKMVSAGQVFAGLALLCMAAAGSYLQAVAVMFAAGMGRAVALPPASKAIFDWLPPSSRGTAMGIAKMGVPVAGVFVAFVCPPIALVFGWRAAMASIGVVAIVSGLASAAAYREASGSAQRSVRGQGIGSSLREVAGNRGLWMVGGMAILLVTVQTAFLAYLPLYLFEVVLPASIPDDPTRVVAAGGYLALAQVGGLLGRMGWGLVSDRLLRGRRKALLAFIAALSGLMALAIGVPGGSIPLWLLTAAVFLFGVAANGWNGLYQVAIVETAGRRLAGTGVGFCMTLSQVGTVGGPLAYGLLVDITRSYHPAWLFLSLCGGAAAMVAMSESKRERQEAWQEG